VRFQLVFQFEAHTIKDFDSLIELETFLIEALASERNAVVDGHDFGSGEFNIFVHTEAPRDLCGKIGDLVGHRHPDLPFSAGFRAFDEDSYTALWPPSLISFTVS
jgi:hypothetical protein